jgi:hypothetical protein
LNEPLAVHLINVGFFLLDESLPDTPVRLSIFLLIGALLVLRLPLLSVSAREVFSHSLFLFVGVSISNLASFSSLALSISSRRHRPSFIGERDKKTTNETSRYSTQQRASLIDWTHDGRATAHCCTRRTYSQADRAQQQGNTTARKRADRRSIVSSDEQRERRIFMLLSTVFIEKRTTNETLATSETESLGRQVTHS